MKKSRNSTGGTSINRRELNQKRIRIMDDQKRNGYKFEIKKRQQRDKGHLEQEGSRAGGLKNYYYYY